MCSFLAIIELNRILAFILRTIASQQFCCIIAQTDDRIHTVFNKEIKGCPWLRREALGATYSHGSRLSVE